MRLRKFQKVYAEAEILHKKYYKGLNERWVIPDGAYRLCWFNAFSLLKRCIDSNDVRLIILINGTV